MTTTDAKEFNRLADRLERFARILEGARKHDGNNLCVWSSDVPLVTEAASALRTAAAASSAGAVKGAPVGYITGIWWKARQSETAIKVTRQPQPSYGFTTPLYTADQLSALITEPAKAGDAVLVREALDTAAAHGWRVGRDACVAWCNSNGCPTAGTLLSRLPAAEPGCKALSTTAPQPDTAAQFPSDGSCVRCGAVPRTASGLCNTCLDEDAGRAGEIDTAAQGGKQSDGGVRWGDSGPIPGQHFGDEFAAEPAPAEPVAWRDIIKRPDERSLPTYGHIPWGQLGRDVVESATARRDDYKFAENLYPGHQIVPGINFNSLARIVDKYRYYGLPCDSHPPRSVDVEAIKRKIHGVYGVGIGTFAGGFQDESIDKAARSIARMIEGE